MGVITCTAPMNPTGDVTYTHKKFKRAASEACDNADQQKQPQPQQQVQPKQTQPLQHDVRKHHDKTVVVESGARTTTITTSGGQTTHINGHLPAQLNSQLTSNVGGHFSSSDGDEVKKKNSGNGGGGGKYKCEYCGVLCAKPSVLGKHIRTHTNERPYSCDQCQIAFKTKSNYLKHTKSRAHVVKCDGVGKDEVLLEVSDSATDGERGRESPRCPVVADVTVVSQVVQNQPADLSVARPSRDLLLSSSVAPTAPRLPHHQEELIKDRGKSLYKPKFRAQYSLRDESGVPKGNTPPPPPPLLGHQPAVPTPHDVSSQLQCNTSSNPATYQPHAASNSNNSHSSPGQHSACLPPLDIRAAAAAANNKKEDLALSGQRSSSGVTPSSANTLWKGMKSPSPELLGQHITKLIVENQAIVETHNPLWSRRYRRQSSLGSSSSESDGSGSGKSRRCSLVDTSSKNSKLSASGPPPVSYGSGQSHPRERSHSLTGEALMIEPQSSYSPSLPPTPHLPLAQPPVTLISASKPSISSHGHTTTSYSQSDPAFATSHMGIPVLDLDSSEGPRKRSMSEGLGVVRDLPKGRVHSKNPEGSVIKNLILNARANITCALDQQNIERLEQSRIASQNVNAPPSAEGVQHIRSWCKTSPENLEFNARHYSGHRQGGSGSERGTPDSVKSGGEGGRWSGEQDVALDLQKKDRADPYEHERSSSRGSSISVGESTQRRGSDEDIRYRADLSPRIYGNEVACDVASPPTKKRKMSEAESTIHDKSMFLSPVFSPKGQLGKNDSSMKMMEEMSKHKPSSRHFFGGEVQICDGKNLKTMRIDPSQQPSPTLDICIPPQQLGGSIARSEVSVPTSVVVTIAKSGLNSGGTMVQVESQMSTSSTKTAPSLVNSLLPQDQPPRVDPSRHPSKPPPPHPPNMYPADAPHFPFSPSFYQYAPLLPLPNLTIPGIPTPDLGDLSYPMNPPNASSQPFLHSGQAPPPTQKQNAPQSPSSHPRAGIPSPLSHPRASVQSPLSHPRAGIQSPLSHPRAGIQSPLSHPRAAIQSPLSHPRAATIQSTVSHPRACVTLSQAITSGPLACVSAGMPMPSSPKIGQPGGPSTIMMRDKEKEHHRKASSYPALIPMGNEKVPYVPGIPGPYSQAGSIVQPQSSHSMQKSPLAVFTPPVPAPSLSPATSKTHLASVPSPAPVPLMMMNEGKEKHLTVPRLREMSREPQRTQAKDLSPFTDSPKYPPKIVSHVSPKDIHGPVDRTKLSITPVKPSEVKYVNPEIRIHPVISSPPLHQEKRDSEKNPIQDEALDSEDFIPESSIIPKDFLPPRKRPNSLALKPQPYMPKSDALIGTILVSPDTPRPKKSCVQMLLNGSAYTYLGHKVSTKSYFCCIYRQQPMYVPQSTDPKLSMYSNWQIRKPAEDNPFELTPYQSLGLYQSRKYNHAYTIAKEKELNLIQTHSSYWTFKEENEKNKEKEDSNSKVDEKDIKTENSVTETSEPSTAETSGTSVKREPDDQSNDFSCKSEDGDGFDGSAKRIKIFEGGFKSTEEYTYVRGRGRGRYVCGACGIRCKKPSMLKKHIRTHTDLRPYACGHCSFSFKTKGNLTKHLRSKAHYKRCVEMGVVPVPTVVDESHVNEEALALQGKMEQERIDEEDDDDDGDDDDDDDEEIDEDEEDDEAMDEDQFEDADDLKEFKEEEETMHGKNTESSQPLKDTKEDSRDLIAHSTPAVSRAGVLVMLPSVNNSLDSCNQGSGEGKLSSSGVSSVDSSSTRDSPIDLSVKKLAASFANSTVHEKSIPIKKPSIPARPNFLPLLSKSSVGDLRSPVGNLVSPGTPSTPIREHPSEILSPVTESSTLLKSIYNTTLRISNVSSGEMQSIVPDPTKENGCNSSMLHTYLKERAMVDTTFKRQQYKSSSSDTSPESPQGNSVRAPSEFATVAENVAAELPLPKPETAASNGNGKVFVDECKRDGKGDAAASQALNVVEQNQTSMPSSIGSCSTITISNASPAITSRMPTPPANLTVMNSGGMDTKTAFLVPSGVVPSSLNRLGNDDGKCKCSICHKEFNKQSQLSIHMNIHYMERPYRCDSCAVSFRTNGHLQKHKRSLSHYNKVNMNMTFGTPSTDNPRPFKCHDCKIAFRIHGHLAKHLRSKMHIMKLECLGKLPFGTYAEIERSGANLNEIDTTDCDNSLESLQSMATRLYEKEPSKLAAWRNQQDTLHHRVRTVSNSSTNSDDYPLQDEQDDPLSGCGNDEDTEGDDDEELPVPHEASGRISIPGALLGPSPSDSHSPQSNALQTIEIGSQQLTQPVVHPYTCELCEAKFSSHSQLIIHSQQNCTVKSS